MYNEKKRQKFGIKVLILLVSVSMIVGLAVGGTMAWLTDKTSEVKNTFTTSDVDIELTETKGTENGNAREFKMIPGHTIDKDPVVTVKANSEKCYVFIKVSENNNAYTVTENNVEKTYNYLTYSVKTEETAEKNYKWTKLDGVYNVWYLIAEASEANQPFDVLTDNIVTVDYDVTKPMMEAAKTKQPSLTFTAYACQFLKNNNDSFTAAEAWANVNPTIVTP